jgi:hypothetical protein
MSKVTFGIVVIAALVTYSNDRGHVWFEGSAISLLTQSAVETSRLLDSNVPDRRCNIFAEGPPRFDKQNRLIIGVGERGPDCETSARLRVSLKIWAGVSLGPDKSLITYRRYVTNDKLTASYRCKFPIRGLVFVEVESEGKKVTSGRVDLEAATKDCRP